MVSFAGYPLLVDGRLVGVVALFARHRLVEVMAVIGRQLGHAMAERLIPPRLRHSHHDGLTRYLTTGEDRVLGRRVELLAQRRDGAQFPIELTVARIATRGPGDRPGRLAHQPRMSRAIAVLDAVFPVLEGGRRRR